jgi:hypothetical protein
MPDYLTASVRHIAKVGAKRLNLVPFWSVPIFHIT